MSVPRNPSSSSSLQGTAETVWIVIEFIQRCIILSESIPESLSLIVIVNIC